MEKGDVLVVKSIDRLGRNYDEILEKAKGTTVNFYGYGGNEVMNKWFDTYVVDQMKEKYDIIGDVRGIGGMLGVELSKTKKARSQTRNLYQNWFRQHFRRDCYWKMQVLAAM